MIINEFREPTITKRFKDFLCLFWPLNDFVNYNLNFACFANIIPISTVPFLFFFFFFFFFSIL